MTARVRIPSQANPYAVVMLRPSVPPNTTTARQRHGVTLLEVVIAMALAGILLGIGAVGLRPPEVRVASGAGASIVQQARFEAIRSNRPMVVRATAEAVTVHRGPSATSVDCAAALPETRRLDLTTFRRVSATDTNGFPFVWLPTGEPRTCPTGAAPLPPGGASLHLDGSHVRTLHVNVAGEVSVR